MTEIKKLEKSITKFTDYFVNRYFGNDATDVYWIADEIGGVLLINDHFFNLDSMMDYVRYDYSSDEMDEHYWYSVECKKSPINIKNWKKLK